MVKAASSRLYEHIEGFRCADLELIGFHWLDIEAVGLHDGHREAGNSHIEQTHGSGVDEAQAQAFAWPEQPGPVFVRAVTIHQIGVGGRGHIGQIRAIHAHIAPVGTLSQSGRHAELPDIVHKIAQRTLLEVVALTHGLQLAEDALRTLVAPVRQQDDVFAVVAEGFRFTRVDDDRTVMPELLLQSAVAVVPVSPRLS
jgi:hypothetical protein